MSAIPGYDETMDLYAGVIAEKMKSVGKDVWENEISDESRKIWDESVKELKVFAVAMKHIMSRKMTLEDWQDFGNRASKLAGFAFGDGAIECADNGFPY